MPSTGGQTFNFKRRGSNGKMSERNRVSKLVVRVVLFRNKEFAHHAACVL